MPVVSTTVASRTVRWLPAVAILSILGGCSTSSNRFQYANSTRKDRDRDRLAELDRPSPPPAQAIVAVPATPQPRSGEFDPPPSSYAREQLLPPAGRALDAGANPPVAAAPFDPPRRESDFAGNRTRVIETPRPGERGSGLTQAANGPELAGRATNSFGRPEPGVSIQVARAARPSQVVAEVATGSDGSFRVSYLDAGVQYRLNAAVVSGGRRLVGSALATPPDTAVVIQLDREDSSSFSAIGNRLTPAVDYRDSRNGDRQPLELTRGNMAVSTPRLRDLDDDRISNDRESRTPSGRKPFDERAGGTTAAFATLTAYSFDGRPQQLGDNSGRLILLDFFASWCGPCRRSIPTINALHRRYGNRGLQIIGLASESGDRTTALAQTRRVANDLRIEYAVLACPSDEASPARDFFQINSFPTLVLLDRNGRVLFRHTGSDTESFRRLDQIIAANL